MRREELLDILTRLPERFHPFVNLVMQNRQVVSIDVVARLEATYLVCRGREGGSTDEGRSFFVPYDQISYVRVEQSLKVGDLKKLYGETGYVDTSDTLGQQIEAEAAAAAEKAEAASRQLLVDTQTPLPSALPTDPASIAKQNLLDRIRAARANAASGATGKLGGK